MYNLVTALSNPEWAQLRATYSVALMTLCFEIVMQKPTVIANKEKETAPLFTEL